MKTLYHACILTLLATVPSAEARFVTFALTTTNQTNNITIEQYETAKVVTFYDFLGGQSRIQISKEQAIIRATPGYYGCSSGNVFPPCQSVSTSLGPLPFVLAGPAAISFESFNTFVRDETKPAVLTIEITPEAYPPDRSITLAPGTGGATITLECSTNLVNWASATNGVYTNPPEAKFFRIKAERIP